MMAAGKRLGALFLTCALVLAGSFAPAQTKPLLCVATFPEMRTLVNLGSSADRLFSLTFLHSVALTEVVDTYRIDATEIVQVSETFSQHGAGLPSQREDVGVTDWKHENGLFTVELDRKVSPLIIRVQSGYKNILKYNGQTHVMKDWAFGALLLHPCNGLAPLKEMING